VVDALVVVRGGETGDGEDDRLAGGDVGGVDAVGVKIGIEGVGEDDDAGGVELDVFEDFVAREFAHAEDAPGAFEGATLPETEGTPCLDSVGDERVAQTGAQAAGEPGNGQLGDVAADDEFYA